MPEDIMDKDSARFLKIGSLLVRAYVKEDVPVDQLPYTQSLVNICSTINSKLNTKYDEGDIYGFLIYLRRAGCIPRIRRQENGTSEDDCVDNPIGFSAN